jgi:PAS domain S-box-containing protein
MAPEPPPAELVAAAEALAGADVGITLGDARARGFPLVYANAAFTRITGYPLAEIVGRSCAFLQDEETDAQSVARVRRALAAGVETRVTLRNVRRDGRPFWNELRLAPYHVDGELRYVIGFQLDVTETVRTLEALRGQRDLAERGLAEAEQVIRRQQRELAELRALQAALTPPATVSIPQLDVASAFYPAEGGVAGDFFLVTSSAGGSVTVAVGDVVGHGLRAAQRASFVRASLVTFAAFTDDPHRLLRLANNSLIERGGASEAFVTAVCATFRPEEGTVRIALAGHPPPHWLDRGRPVTEIRGGLPLGLGLDLGGEPEEIHLGSGDGLLFFTDGLPEARPARRTQGARRELFGEPRVDGVLRELEGAPAGPTVERLSSAVRGFVAGPLADDMCLVAVRTRP